MKTSTLTRPKKLAWGAIFLCAAAIASAQVPTPGSSDHGVLKHLAAEWQAAQADFAKHPKDAKVRERYVTAGVRYGHESMMSPILPAKIKYRQAVLIYRKVLAVDPKNPVARPEYDMMIKIYKQMGRPIPK